ncbi:citrate lyase ligase [Vibrio sp. T20]|uniref:citrate lyase ligase n=1 Tax=Vibrio sp. T20 TaxID=2588450 RepID=UPI001645C7E5|nr:citrate lyase ligase [Vibrio sp. T20]
MQSKSQSYKLTFYWVLKSLYRLLPILPSKIKMSKNLRLAELYVQKKDYKKATSLIEELVYKFKKNEYSFMLLNLYLMNGDSEKSKELEVSLDSTSESTNLVKSLDILNSSVNDSDKVAFIKSYIATKGASSVLIDVQSGGDHLTKLSNEEKILVNNTKLYLKQRRDWSRRNSPPTYIKSLYSKDEQNKIDELFCDVLPIVRATKVSLSDHDSSVISVKNGFRATTGQPEISDRRVLFFGASTTFSYGMSDKNTIVSQVQKNINKVTDNVRVENHGVLGMNLLLAMNNLVQTEIKQGDVIVFFNFDEFKNVEDPDVFSIDLNDVDRGGDFFIDLNARHCHYSPKGNKAMGEIVTNKLIPVLNSKSEPVSTQLDSNNRMFCVLEKFKYFLFRHTAQALESCEIQSYLELLKQYASDCEGVIGSVAVNCNPITKGHLHLLEHASRSVDKLFIFVIEEDKSFFKFEDRLHLVAESTKHLDNATVLRGGKFICTELTYPDYFDKDTTEAKADASMEAWFFCEYIAKTLNISKIFLGDEPKCMITKQYNEKMRELLPEYGIEVDIIDRIETNGDVISASKVREFLASRDFSSIEAIVPKPTYQFLKENY